MSHESIKSPPTSDNSFTPLIDYYGYNIRVKFNGSILRQPKVSYTYEKAVNIYIVYEISFSSHSDDLTLKNCLFGAVTLTENADIDNMSILTMELVLLENRVVRFQAMNSVKM